MGKLGQDPAFPVIYDIGKQMHRDFGMSKRAYIATQVMAALLNRTGYYWQDSGTSRENLNGLLPEEAAKLSLQYADELLKQENDG